MIHGDMDHVSCTLPLPTPMTKATHFFVFNQQKIALQFCVGFCHNKANQSLLYICIYLSIYLYPPSLLSLLPLPHSTLLGYHRSPDWAPCIIQQLPTVLSAFHMTMYICQRYFLNLSHPHLFLLCPQVHFPLGSSEPFFQIPYICINTQYFSFSF